MEYEELEDSEWEWQSVNEVMTKVPLGCAATGPNPTDRAKLGVKRSLLTDGSGIPLAVVLDRANRPDAKLLVATLDGTVMARPASSGDALSEDKTSEQHQHQQHLSLDAGYDSEAMREEVELRSPHPSSR